MWDPRRLVEAARMAPSGDNCQPFHFMWDGEQLSVVHEPERAHHALDSGHHGSLLTLGMIAASLDLAASAEGLALETQLHVRHGAGGAWMRCAPVPATCERDPLLDGLAARHTDRRLYRGGRMDAPVVRAMCAEETDDVAVHACAADSAEMSEWLRFGDEALWEAPAVTDDALRWVHFDEQALRGAGDGVGWRNLGLPAPLAAGVAISRALPWTLRLGARLGGPQMTGALLRAQLASSAGLIAFTTRDASPEGLVEVGRVAMRAWIRCNLGGWAAQPMSLGVILALAARDGALPDVVPGHLGAGALSRWEALREAMGVDRGASLGFLLRVGRNPPLDARLRPPRRSVNDLLRPATEGAR